VASKCERRLCSVETAVKTWKPDLPGSPAKPDHRKRSWHEIEKNLRQRGSLTVWVTEEAIAQWMQPERTGKPGRPPLYHDIAIQTGCTIKAVYKAPWRQTEGFLESIFRLMHVPLAVPDATTFSRRMPGLEITLPKRVQPGEPVHMVIDSTGLKVYGAGEWHMHKHGLRKRRRYRKLHLFIDAETCEILEVELTDDMTHDGTMLPIFMERNEERIDVLYADGAYDQYPCYEALAKKHARPVIPPRCDAVVHNKDPDGVLKFRNTNLEEIDRIGLEAWKHKREYYKQSIAENGMSRYKTIFGDRLYSRLFPSQKNEAKINCIILNTMINLGKQT